MLAELLYGAGAVCLYLAVAASCMLMLRWLISIPDELFRKALHFVLLGSYIPFIRAFDTWWLAALLAVLLEILIYPALVWAEHFRSFSSFVTERKSGEFKRSLLLAFSMLAFCITICWGWMGQKYMVLACMYAWGVGDAFAALIGKRFGKHKIRLRLADPHKSVEGSTAMFLSSLAAVMLVLLRTGNLNWLACLGVAAAGAGAATLVEMFTPDGMDTITCPLAAMTVILPLTAALGGML